MRKFTKGCTAFALKAKRMGYLTLLGCMMSTSMSAFAAHSVSGVVLDEKSVPMPGVVVQINGTTVGAITDQDGAYQIPNVEDGQELFFQFVGYKAQTVPANKDQVNVTLEVDALQMDEVVVVGFGSQKKVNLTGSVSVVDEEVFEARPVNSASQALQGVVPGLNISSNSGGLGETASMNVRGKGTIGSSKDSPLVLIDGMEGDINSLNPQDIASISVLKDAASSSIYGSRAPFGVILVTTKKGKAGRMTVNYNNSFRFSTQANLSEMQSSPEFLNFFQDMQINTGISTWITPEYKERVAKYAADPTGMNACNENTTNGTWNIGPQAGGNANIDWLDKVYKDWTFGQEHNFTISGGNEKQQVYASINYLDQNGFSEWNTDSYQRFSTNLRATGNITDFLKYNYSFKYQQTAFEAPIALGKVSAKQKVAYPITPEFDPDGNEVDSYHNYLQNGGTETKDVHRLYQQFQLVATPIKGWNITAEVNYKLTSTRDHEDTQLVYTYNVNQEPSILPAYATNSSVYEKSAISTYINPNVFTDYSFTLNDKHNFKVMVGFQSEKNHANNFNAKSYGLMVPGGQVINLTDGTAPSGGIVAPEVAGDINDWSTSGFFGRFNYDYDGRYLAEVNVRYDGTSRFRSETRWDTFPSFSLGWNVAKEKFWEDYTKYVSVFKFRGSYGELGNQNTNNLYPTYSEMKLGQADSEWLVNGALQNTANPAALIDPSLTWETIKTTNIGVDIAALRNRLNVSFDWFQRATTNMVGPATDMPETLGTEVPNSNNTDLMNRGWETSIRWNDRTKGGFGYSVGLVLSDSQTEITSYPNDNKELKFKYDNFNTDVNGGQLENYYTGQMLGEIWGYTTIGIAQTDADMAAHIAKVDQSVMPDIKKMKGAEKNKWAAGDIMYADLNGDGKLNKGAYTVDNPGDLSIIGNTTPRYQFGINLSANYKGFDASAFFQGTMKRDYASMDGTFFGCGAGEWQVVAFKEHMDYFRNENSASVKDVNYGLGVNTDAYYPRPVRGKKNSQIQSRYLLDASYIRLKNLQVGYTFDKELLSKIKVSNLRVFVSAENLWTGTNLSPIYDPETIDGANYGVNYPIQSTVSVGLNVSF